MGANAYGVRIILTGPLLGFFVAGFGMHREPTQEFYLSPLRHVHGIRLFDYPFSAK
jgi:hypothetical protein